MLGGLRPKLFKKLSLYVIYGSPFPKPITFLFEDQISSLLFLSFAKRLFF